MKRTLIVLFSLMLCRGLIAQTHTCKYWFDNNDGQSVTTSFSGNVWDAELDVSHFNDGFHVLHYQLSDTTLSPIKSYLFHKISTIESTNNHYFYWFDNQYSNMQSGTLGDGNILLDVTALADGEHVVRFYFEGSNVAAPQSYVFMKGDGGETYEITATAVTD